jgi:hypothetical protein
MTASSSTDVGSTSLARLLAQRAPSREMAAFLDGLAPDARLREVLSITGSNVGRLYDAVADAEPLTLEEFVPASTPGMLIYEGRNSLPLFSRFQKRFARVRDGVIVGYNHQTMSAVTGPGFFVVKPASGQGEHGKEMFFDYTVDPPEVPAGFPAFKPNGSGLSRLVYMNMIDYCRRVARGVLVGKAYKLGVDQKAWFSLTLPG